ncbi:hypothetical protein GCM10009422_10990 [Brevundimonas kwangchunensis]|uniref:SseB protein N-terminal domain-containing protein n=1 Tax=Brevundimonas kwangchunensis TaxID=322163 RepID=A0ABN1GRR2_9CAUL
MTDAVPLTFTDNPMNPLEVALYEGLADHTKMGAFERLMLEVDLFAVPEPGTPGGVHGDDGHKVLKEGEQLILRGLVLNDGRDTVTLFTDPRRAPPIFGDDCRILAMNGRRLLEMVQDKVVLLNPDGGKGLLLQPDQLKAVLEHAPAVPEPVRPTGTVELSDVRPVDYPIALIEALNEVFASIRAESAWLARSRWVETGQTGWYVDIRTPEEPATVRAIVGRALRGLDAAGETFDVAVSKPGGEDGVGIRL